MDTGTATFLTVVASAAFQLYRERRDRSWQRESALTQENIGRQITKESNKIQGDVAENTTISTNAFEEANTVNLKLEKLGITQVKLDKAIKKQGKK
jgi:hypothetical protein